jgi:peptide/nickel transport system permease protein
MRARCRPTRLGRIVPARRVDRRIYFIRKIANALLLLVLVASFNFFLFRVIPGDPARLLVPRGRFSSDIIEKQREAFHLDEKLYMQFLHYWKDTAQFKFGQSFKEKRSVAEVVQERIWPTVILVGTGTVLATIVGLIAGVFAGWKRNGKFDVASTNIGMIAYSMPTFWSGMLIIMLFSVKLGWFPVGRMSDPGTPFNMWGPIPTDWESAKTLLHHLALPAITFAITYAGEYQLIMRSSLTGVMNEDFVLTARAKGLSDNNVLWRHVAPNAMLPTVTLVMMNLGFVMTGAILAETIFNWPGLGLLSYESMNNRDYPVMQAVFLLASVAVVVANAMADIMYYYLDPRVKA